MCGLGCYRVNDVAAIILFVGDNHRAVIEDCFPQRVRLAPRDICIPASVGLGRCSGSLQLDFPRPRVWIDDTDWASAIESRIMVDDLVQEELSSDILGNPWSSRADLHLIERDRFRLVSLQFGHVRCPSFWFLLGCFFRGCKFGDHIAGQVLRARHPCSIVLWVLECYPCQRFRDLLRSLIEQVSHIVHVEVATLFAGDRHSIRDCFGATRDVMGTDLPSRQERCRNTDLVSLVPDLDSHCHRTIGILPEKACSGTILKP